MRSVSVTASRSGCERFEWRYADVSAERSTPSVPYYEDDFVTLYHADCRQLIGWLTAGHVFITDPPYGTNFYLSDTDAFTADYLRAMTNSRTVAVFGWPERLVAYCVEAQVTPSEWVTWWPTNKTTGRVGCRLPRESEHIAIFGETVGAARLRRPRSVERYGRERVEGMGLDPETARLGDVWRDPSPGAGHNHHLRQHPNEKPISVMAKLVQLCSDPGDTICDPFCGSGSTLVAAKAAGRKAIGVEIEERFCEIAARRCSQEVLVIA